MGQQPILQCRLVFQGAIPHRPIVGGYKDQPGDAGEPNKQAHGRPLRHRYRAWRRPAGELTIVVVGVVLGLLATEWVSEQKSRHDVNEAQAALKRELSVGLAAVRFRQQIKPCVRRRLAELLDWIGDQRLGNRAALPDEIGRPAGRLAGTSVWEVAKSGQVATKMELEDKLRFATIYDGLETFNNMVFSERDIWFEIGDFAGLSVSDLSAVQLARLRGLVSRAAAFDEAMSGNSATMIGRFRELGILSYTPLPPGLSARRAICQPFARQEP